MSRGFTLANHVQELLDERDYWLAAPPPDLPDFAARLFSEEAVVGRRKQAAAIDKEIADAIELLRKGGHITTKGVTV